MLRNQRDTGNWYLARDALLKVNKRQQQHVLQIANSQQPVASGHQLELITTFGNT